jgi:glycosyltransferase involved in cell wall biosynthesis
VLPSERVCRGEPSPGWTAALRRLSVSVAGFVTDSEDSADVLERVISDRSVEVLVFPFAGPVCGDSSTRRLTVTSDDEESPGPVELLGVWHDLMTGAPGAISATSMWSVRRWTEGHVDSMRSAGRWEADAEAILDGHPAIPNPVSAAIHSRRSTIDAMFRGREYPQRYRGAPALKVAVIGHDLKFVREISRLLEEQPDLIVDLDEWASAGRNNGAFTDALAQHADVLVAEWARPNAAWLSRVKRPDQRLIVRLHRFELSSRYPEEIEIDAVDAVVYIAPSIGLRIRDELGWPADKLIYIPNYLASHRLDRPKLPDARFCLGMVGATLALKRLDLALELLARTREQDPRFHLRVRTRMPWELKSAWADHRERLFFRTCMERVEHDPLLRGAVSFDPFGADVNAWFRQVGHVLSLSDIEGSHEALSEGMASGAVPVIRMWPGADTQYDMEWIRRDLNDAAAFVLGSAAETVWEERSRLAKLEIVSRYQPWSVIEAWHDLVRGETQTARGHFAKRSLLDS